MQDNGSLLMLEKKEGPGYSERERKRDLSRNEERLQSYHGGQFSD